MEKFITIPKFHSKDEEIQYWLDMVHRLYNKQEEAMNELKEYQENSIILEQELESSFEQAMGKNRDLQLTNNKLSHENEDLKERLNEQVRACLELQCKVEEMRKVIDEISSQITKLELQNDDLERTNRELKVSEEAMEEKFNDVLEKLALLETDVEEKEALQIFVQRLKDENKDLKQQIEIDLRKSQDSPLTRFRKMRRQQQRNSAESEKNLSLHEEATDVNSSFKNDRNNLYEYICELEREIKYLKKNQRTSKVVVVDVTTETNVTIETDFFCEPKLDEEEEESTQLDEAEGQNNKDQSHEAQVKIRLPRGVRVERSPQLLSAQSKVQDDNARALPANRATRILENRVKKVKDEEKRENLVHFLKRFRYRQPKWMRKKH